MKFIINNKKSLSVFLLVISIIIISVNTLSNRIKEKNKYTNKATSESKAKNSNNLDYMTYMSQKKEPEIKIYKQKRDNFKFKSKGIETSEKYPVKKGDILESWMIISSEEFHNIKRFPPVALPNGTINYIDTNSLNFRLNKAVKCVTPDANRPDDSRLFWFRLTNTTMYYSSTKEDINVLGEIKIKDVLDVDQNTDISGPKEYFCFNTIDDQDKEWKVCNEKKPTIEKWYCTIKKYIGLTDPEVCNGINTDGDPDGDPSNPGTTVKERKIKKSIIMVPLPSPTCNENWDYNTSGEDWVCDCKEGHSQSPIDLPKREKAIESPIKPVFSYLEVDSINQYSTLDQYQIAGEKLQIRNTDNLLHILHEDMGKVTTMDGTAYKAQEVTFHSPSNHKINGKQYPLEVSIIHFGTTAGDIGKQLVLSFLFEIVPGVYNRFLEDLDLFALPDPIKKTRDITRDIYIPKILFSESAMNETPHMKPFSFYTYTGSLPFPPCTERTINIVAAKPIPVSNTSITLIKEAMKIPELRTKTGDIIASEQSETTNRSIQDTNGRPVYYYNVEKFEGPELPTGRLEPKQPKSGHYEKVTNEGTQYFYVSSSAPSGLPGSFVISEREAKGLSYDHEAYATTQGGKIVG